MITLITVFIHKSAHDKLNNYGCKKIKVCVYVCIFVQKKIDEIDCVKSAHSCHKFVQLHLTLLSGFRMFS